MTEKDRIYAEKLSKVKDFVFDERVVRVFPDMINRSVPGYDLIVPMMGMLARRYATADSNLYDLGCSLGAVSLAMQGAVSKPGVHIRAIDNSPDMIEQFRSRLESQRAEQARIEPILQDIRETTIENASVVAMNFTLQFVPVGERSELLRNIHSGLNPKGVLLLSEKTAFSDSVEDLLLNSWHHDFKRAQGYSELEISGKRDALEHVMIPETMECHRARLCEAGFRRVVPWFQGFNFVSLVAFADDV